MNLKVEIVSETRIQSAEFGDYHYKRFLEWCFVERQSKASMLRNVAVARTEANRNEIDLGIEHYARLYGQDPEQLKEYIYIADKAGISFSALQDRMSQGLRGEDAHGKPINRKRKE